MALEKTRNVRQFLVIGAMAAAAASAACGDTCGLGLHGRITLHGVGPVPCCGGSRYQDVDLTAKNIQVDIANAQLAGDTHVDAFVTTTSCAKLFDGPYPGAVPLCTIYVGPVPAGSVSQRVTLPSGTYRVFVQAHSTNTIETRPDIDVGIWDHRCVTPTGGGSQ